MFVALSNHTKKERKLTHFRCILKTHGIPTRNNTLSLHPTNNVTSHIFDAFSNHTEYIQQSHIFRELSEHRQTYAKISHMFVCRCISQHIKHLIANCTKSVSPPSPPHPRLCFLAQPHIICAEHAGSTTYVPPPSPPLLPSWSVISAHGLVASEKRCADEAGRDHCSPLEGGF